jgi:hypothetical protein
MEAPHAQWLWPHWQKRSRKKGPREAARPSRSRTTSGRPGVKTPLGAVKFDSEVCGPQHGGRTPSPHKGAQGKKASSLFRPNLLAASKGGCDVEAKAVAEDDSDDIEAKALAKDDSNDDKGASIG